MELLRYTLTKRTVAWLQPPYYFRTPGERINQEGQNAKAVDVLDFAMEKMPAEKFGYNYFLFESLILTTALEQRTKRVS